MSSGTLVEVIIEGLMFLLANMYMCFVILKSEKGINETLKNGMVGLFFMLCAIFFRLR